MSWSVYALVVNSALNFLVGLVSLGGLTYVSTGILWSTLSPYHLKGLDQGYPCLYGGTSPLLQLPLNPIQPHHLSVGSLDTAYSEYS